MISSSSWVVAGSGRTRPEMPAPSACLSGASPGAVPARPAGRCPIGATPPVAPAGCPRCGLRLGQHGGNDRVRGQAGSRLNIETTKAARPPRATGSRRTSLACRRERQRSARLLQPPTGGQRTTVRRWMTGRPSARRRSGITPAAARRCRSAASRQRPPPGTVGLRQPITAPTQSGAQGGSLRRWQLVDTVLYRSQQLMQRREGELRLRFDARGAQHGEPTCLCGGVLQQR